MKTLSPALVKSLAVRTAVAAAAFAACSVAMAASSFTFDPSKIAGVTAPIFSADTLTVNDYANVNLSGSSFTETGDLSVSAFNLGNTQVFPTGYGSSYGLYVMFSSAGTGGVLSALDYSVYGYSGPIASFDVTTAGPTKSGSVGTLLATGSLIPGPTNTFSGGVGGASLTANTLTFNNVAGAFSNVTGATASFINQASQITPTAGGFLVKAGGGTINLVAAVPEPETYALLLAGLAAVGFVARRRQNG